ncbi:N-6 DNA methylase [Nocardioides panacisoli]|uniref:N-6 DNA methylase n=1 Tax=Nocardioides panacisoli TaxID=627624 RepID=UPI001C63356B|nr:N-6 DNA methylase [Nocardioides panacisoli]QYJ04178.1 N-6 DNA methylase [Nocardioides panacisoli]
MTLVGDEPIRVLSSAMFFTAGAMAAFRAASLILNFRSLSVWLILLDHYANITNMTDTATVPSTLQAIRAALDLTQAELAERLGVSFATVNRWEGGANKPQRAQLAKITALAEEAGVDLGDAPVVGGAVVTRRRGRQAKSATPTTKPMEQMLWDAACSIRGERDAPKFRDYLLPLLFLKRLSDVFDDEIDRLAEEYGDREVAIEIADNDHSLLRFYLPPEARWAVISGRAQYDWPDDERGRSTRPRDVGEHLTKAVRAVVRYNPTLAGVIDVVDFAAERNGERDINPGKLNGVVETFSDPRYRLGLADVQPDFLGRAYEYLLRKFAEGSGQSAGEFFTPTEVGFLMARILRPKPGQACHDYACGSAGLLIKLQLVANELDPTAKVPLKLYGQELQAESYAVARMNAIIHDMDIDLRRGDTMINPKFRTPSGSLDQFDLVVANPMWNQPFGASIFEDDPYDRFIRHGGATSGKGDWAWVQHTSTVLKDGGRAAVVLDTGAVTRGSGSRNQDKERNIRKWFVDQDLIEGVILMPDNLFYNTMAAGVIVVLNKRKPESKKGQITLVNASKRFTKGKPKNHLAEEDVADLARLFNTGEPVEGEVAVIDLQQAADADYNLSPSRWIQQASALDHRTVPELLSELVELDSAARQIDEALANMLVKL